MNARTIPGEIDTGTIPGEIDTGTIPGEIDTGTIPGEIDTGTIPGEIDTGTIPGEIDTGTIPGEIDTGTISSSDEPELSNDISAERVAALLAHLPNDVETHIQNNNTTFSQLVELNTLNRLFMKLHASGLQQKSLPPEFTPTCISSLLLTVKQILGKEPSCLELSSPIILCGDIHGEFHQLAKLMDILGSPPLRSYLFLGDYVDRGEHSLETILYLLLLKILHSEMVFLLRGNHEDRRVYRTYHFEDDLVREFGLMQGQNLSSLFHTVLCYMPVCAILNSEIFCCHGGLSPQFNHPKFAGNQKELVCRINQLPKPVLFRRSDFVADLLWSDPLDIRGGCMPNLQSVAFSLDEWLDRRLAALEAPLEVRKHQTRENHQAEPVTPSPELSDAAGKSKLAIDWMPSPRGVSYVFSNSAFIEFSMRYQINWLIRGHEYVSRGYRDCFDGRCITLFSAADYARKFHNIGAVMFIDQVSNGLDFPGRFLCFGKKPLMRFMGQLPVDPSMWPSYIGGR